MMASRVISLAVFPWTVHAPEPESISFSPGFGFPLQGGTSVFTEAAYRDVLARGLAARVPGCIHQALIAAGLIDSPDQADNEARLHWIGRTAWEYRCEFDWSAPPAAADEHLELVIDGLDTVAALTLNDRPIGDAASFYFPHRFDVAAALRPGRNTLGIRFTPPLVHIRDEESRLGARPYNGDTMGWEPFIFIRKPACNLGWDWGPRVATVGIAGGAWIERWSAARIAHIRPLVEHADAGRAQVKIHIDAAIDPNRLSPLRASVTLHDPYGRGIVARGECAVVPGGAPGRATGSAALAIDSPVLWWPRGYGPQAPDEERPRYGIRVQLHADDGPVDSWQGRIGLRTIALDTTPDKWGSAFTFRINGQMIFCMGANWIPEGLFAGYAEEPVIRHRIRDAAEMNANMLRVWGGGLYEPECFYDECDRRGLLVWQDFMFSCGMYPEEAPYGGEDGLVAREARHQLARLSSYASVVLWCGGNETIWGHDRWGWKERLSESGGRSWGSGYWLGLLPRLCAEVDPSRPYWPNSPWSGVDAGGVQRDVLDADHGDRHTWEVDAWKDGFRAPTPGGVARFCSECGQQSPSDLQTLLEQLGDPGETINTAFIAELARRQRGPGGDKRWYVDCGIELPLEMRAQFETPGAAPQKPNATDIARWLDAAQQFQARVVARGIEWHRVNRPRCAGVLFWQLNDCWAGHSWSAIDAAGRRKPLWDAARRAMSPRLLSIHIVKGVPHLFAVNDTDDAWEGELVVRRVERCGTVLAAWRKHARIGPRTAGPVADLRAVLGGSADPNVAMLIAEAEGFQGAGE